MYRKTQDSRIKDRILSANFMRFIENIYVHLPFCLKKCHYCSFPIHAVGRANNDHLMVMQRKYVDKIVKEIYLTTTSLIKSGKWQFRPLQSIYFGGGTPSLFNSKLIGEIVDRIKDCGFKMSNETEVTMECDPGTFVSSQIAELEDVHVNRISLGIQSFDEDTLKYMNRSQSLAQNYQAVEILLGSRTFSTLSNVSFDLIMNLPFSQDQSIWKKSLQTTLKYQPGHVSAYSLQIDPHSNFYEKQSLREGSFPLPSDSQAADTFMMTHKVLEEKYRHYEISSYIKRDCGLPKHNPIYWEGDKSFLAFGMGASSLIGDKRFTRPRTLTKYYEFIESIVDQPNFILKEGEDEGDIQQRLEAILLGRLRTEAGVEVKYLRKIINNDQVFEQFLTNIENLKEIQPFLQLEQGALTLAQPEGLLFCDDIVAELSVTFAKALKQVQKQYNKVDHKQP